MQPRTHALREVLSAFAALATVLVACSSPDPEASDGSPPVVETAVVAIAQPAAQSLPGRVRALQQSSLGFPFGGRLIEVGVREGDHVEAGQVLARLDGDLLRLAVRQRRAEVELAETERRQAEREWNRERQLREDGASTAARYDAAETRVAAAAGRAELARAALASARDRRIDGTLRAPFAGVVAARLAEPGESVAPGAPVLRLTSPGDVEVVVSVPESMVARLDPDALHRVRLPAGGSELTARVAGIASDATPAGTFEVRLALPSRPAMPRPGLTAEVQLRLTRDEALQIPASAFGRLPDGRPYVLVVGEDRSLERRPIVLRELNDDRALIESGIEADERVVLRGLSFLSEGARVRVLDGPADAVVASR